MTNQVTNDMLASGAVTPSILANSGSELGLRNRIINGAMMIAQRGTSFATPATGTYTLDRWLVQWTGAAPASVAQVAGTGAFKNALQITGNTGNTLTQINQRIESYNCSDLSGATVTIQANIAVSSAQTLLWALRYANATDNFSTETTISTGTWSATTTATTFTATITGLPAGAVNGLEFQIYPQNGGAFTSGTFTITGVQLEKGATATPFDYRPIGTELALCQRYFETSNGACVYTRGDSVNISAGSVTYAVDKRTTPTIVLTNQTGTCTVSPTTVRGFGVGITGVSYGQFGYTSSAEL